MHARSHTPNGSFQENEDPLIIPIFLVRTFGTPIEILLFGITLREVAGYFELNNYTPLRSPLERVISETLNPKP